MAKPTKTKNEGRCVKINTPSQFGSHKKMVVRDLGDGRVICKDPYGEYITQKSRLDNGLADPARFSRYNKSMADIIPLLEVESE